MSQNLAVHISTADISNFFGSLDLSVYSSLQQAELFPADATGKPNFNLNEVTQWKVALSKTQRFGLKDASSFTGTALVLCIKQYKQDNSVKDDMDQFLLEIASMALSTDLFADDISLAFFL